MLVGLLGLRVISAQSGVRRSCESETTRDAVLRS